MVVFQCESDADFAEKVNSAGPKLIVAQLGASWCGPCRDFAGTFESLSAKYDNAVFIKVDVEECEGVGAKFQVASLPTFVLLKEKKKSRQRFGRRQAAARSKDPDLLQGRQQRRLRCQGNDGS